MKRTIGSISGSSPPASPPRQRPTSSSGAGPSRRATSPDGLQARDSASPSSPGGADAPRPPRTTLLPPPAAIVLPPPRGALADLPNDAFEALGSRLGPRARAALAVASKSFAASEAPELQADRVMLATSRVQTAQGFRELLGDPAAPARGTVLALDSRPRSRALQALIPRMAELPAPQRLPAFLASLEQVAELPRPLRPRLLSTLTQQAWLSLPPQQLGAAWPALLTQVEREPAPVRGMLLPALLTVQQRMHPAQRHAALNASFAAVDRLPPDRRTTSMQALLGSLRNAPPVLELRRIATGLAAVAESPAHQRPAMLVSLALGIAALPPEGEEAQPTPADSQRRQGMRGVRDAVQALPLAERAEPLRALAGMLPHLPLRERSWETFALRHAIEQLPEDAMAPALTALFNQARFLPAADRPRALMEDLPRAVALAGQGGPIHQAPMTAWVARIADIPPHMQLDALRSAHQALQALPEPQRAEVLVRLIAPQVFARERGDVVREGIGWASALDAQHRPPVLAALARAIPAVAPAERAELTQQLLTTIAGQPADLGAAPMHHLLTTLGLLAQNDDFANGFDVLREGIAQLPRPQRAMPLRALADDIAQWPAGGQPQRFAAIRAAMTDLPDADQAQVLGNLIDNFESLLVADQPQERAALRAAIEGWARNTLAVDDPLPGRTARDVRHWRRSERNDMLDRLNGL
ncbi:MAG TPA: hypothetical protein VFR90_06510 [Methylibium sp.]|uniref:hypothetical protein n=1 Tax=Methylibium sp. TaxID=2067992 RepID=UPI002DB95FC1|nr:hypothetical protein [Methylibium sp.]HEU4458757.1 hypothetical protein [Methylibium sp.]